MEKKPYSDRRWWEAPKAFDSACNSCTRYHGYAKCDTYPDGIPEFPKVKDTTSIPRGLLLNRYSRRAG